MTDQAIPDVTDEERMLAREWAESVESNTDFWTERICTAARVILHAVPAPPRPTLADMTPDEQDECRGMQADLAQGDRVVILDGTPDAAGLVQVLEKSLDVYRAYPKEVTPRPDLPPLPWPGTEKPAPAPALPEGWRLADHKDHGRVIVTTTEPDEEGDVFFVYQPSDGSGADTRWCTPAELTYIDGPTTKEDDTAGTVPPNTLAVGSVWDDADALARACAESGRDQITVTDCDGDSLVWSADANWWATAAPIPEFAPFTILHAGKKADQ